MSFNRRSIKGDENNWIQTQCAVFKNWVNQNLSGKGMKVDAFETDFSDGIKLINLYEVVAKKSIGRYTKTPNFTNQMLENVTLVIKAMEEDGINMLSIDSEAIVIGNLKLILALVWRMILHYQIGAMTVKIPVKKLVLIWAQNTIPDLRITNLTTDWNSGQAICALIEAIRPGSCPHYKQLKEEDSIENCGLGLKLADERANIPPVVSAENMADPSIDEQSMITYLSYFIQDGGVAEAQAKDLINSWSPEITFTNFNTDWNDGIRLCTLVESLTPGSIPHYKQLQPENGLENIALGMDIAETKMGVPKILKPEDMANPDVTEIAVMAYLLQFRKVVPPDHPTTFTPIREEEEEEIELKPVVFDELESAPQMEPEDEIIPQAAVHEENEIQILDLPDVEESPIEEETGMTVEEYLANAMPADEEPDNRVTADMLVISGTGLTDPRLDAMNEFYVRCDEDFASESLTVKVTNHSRNNDGCFVDRDIPAQLERMNSSLATCRYPLNGAGTYTIDVKYDGEHVSRSPININIVQDLTRITVSGSGLGHTFVNEPAEVKLETGLPNAVLKAHTVSSNGEELPAAVVNQGEGVYLIKYVPHNTGLYGLYISINDETLPGCPYVAKVLDPNSVSISSTQQKEDNQIYAAPECPVALNADISKCGSDYGSFSAQTIGPHNNTVLTQLIENSENVVTFAFIPPTVGLYHTDIFWNNRKLAGCPYTIVVCDPDKCVAHGEGLHQARLNEAACFDVTTIGAGPGKVTASAECNGEQLPVELKQTDADTYNASYYPDSLDQLTVNVAFNDVPVRGSPFYVNVGNPSKCNFEFNHERPVKANAEQSIPVQAGDDAGRGELSCIVKGPNGEVPVMIVDNGNQTKRINFCPKTPGMHEVRIYYAEALLAGCPYMIEVLPASKPEMVVVSGDGLHEARTNEITVVRADCTEAGRGELTASVESKEEYALCPTAVKDNQDGTYDVTYSVPRPQDYFLDIKYDNVHVPGSPFSVNGYSKSDSSQVVLAGEGLKQGKTGEPVQFTLDSRNAGDGKLNCQCISPSGKATVVSVADNHDGTYTVDLNATEAGVHHVKLDWDGQPVPGSPFQVKIMQSANPDRVKVYGPGLDNGLLGDYEGYFSVGTAGAGPGTLKVRIHGPKGAFKVEMFREKEKDRTIGVRYSPKEAGQYTINVLWSGEHVMNSPFHVYLADNKHQLDALITEAGRLSINGYEDKTV
eukprot:gene10826-11978_t